MAMVPYRNRTVAPAGGGVPLQNIQTKPQDFGATSPQVQQSVDKAIQAGNDIGMVLEAGEARIRTQRESVDLARAVGSFNEEANAELRRLTTEGDFSQIDTVKGYGAWLSQKKSKLLDSGAWSEGARARLTERLDTTAFSLGDKAALLGQQAQEKLVTSEVSKEIAGLSANAIDNPGSINRLFASFDAKLDDMAPALTPEQETTFRSMARREITLSVLNGYMSRGAVDEARKVFNDTPGLRDMMTPEQQRTLDTRFAAFETEKNKGIMEGQQELAKLRTILGREPTLAERAQRAGLSADQKAPIFQDLPIEGDKIQRTVSYDGGKTWGKFGEAYDRREPYIVQQVYNADGSISTVAVPRASVTQQMNAAPAAVPAPQPGEAPALPSDAPAQPVAQAQPPAQQEPPAGLPAGSVVIGGKPAAMTEGQANSALFADRAQAANLILAKFDTEGTGTLSRILSKVPGGNYLQSEEYQQFEQAKRDFTEAVLRKVSGAAIGKEEYANADLQYFPQPGDTQTVIEQKRQNRLEAIKGISRAGGPGYKKLDGDKSPSDSPSIIDYDLNGKRISSAKSAG